MLSLLYGVLAASAALCAPTVSLDAATFLQNGMEAQTLNAEFASLNASASCDSGEMACIGASVAHCVNSTWTQEACPKSLSCFALPSVREEGTILSCTTNTTALSVINASGATGGVAVKSTNGTVNFPLDCDDDDEEDAGDAQSSVISTASATGTRTHSSTSQTASISGTGTVPASSFTSAPSSATGSAVTVTVTVAPTSFSVDIGSETTTLNPSQASSFLSSIATDTNFSIETTIRGAAPTASASAGVTSDAAQSSAFSSKPVGIASAPAFTSDIGAPTTITLIGAPATATAASSSAAAKATSAAAIDVGDSYYA